ncbi:MAG: hypothetical protein H5U02_11640 [Clostridia bacterium]|nr:hypothetical protein [Clostridia bacterium]
MGYLEMAQQVPRKTEQEPRSQTDFVTQGKRLLETQGWFAMRSEVLGETVLVAKDGITPPGSDMAAVYTLEELRELAKPPRVGPQELRFLHEAKKRFGGRVVQRPLAPSERDRLIALAGGIKGAKR